MTVFFTFVIALFITMVLIPPLMRASGHLHLVDVPNGRKVHPAVIPRCGGVALVLGALLPIGLWIPMERTAVGLFSGALIVALFGLWDDRRELDYRWKFLGQGLATAVLLSGGVVLEHLPLFADDALAPVVAYPLTALFVLAVTNAVNFSDGLDGLAAGCALIYLAMIAVLAYSVQGYGILLVVAAVSGGILGFLRFNTHPAQVFLGDAGSQFLGFIAAALTVLLVENVHRALSPTLLLFLLGVPLLDAAWITAARIARGRSPFKADRGHVHHKLLALGFAHHEAVATIYLVHAALVSGAYFLAYQSDLLILLLYLGVSGTLMALFYVASSSGWRLRRSADLAAPVERRNLWLRRRAWLPRFAIRYMAYAVAGFLVVGAVLVAEVPRDVALVAAGVAVMALVAAVAWRPYTWFFARLSIYVGSVLITYLLARLPPPFALPAWMLDTYFVALLAVILIAIRVTRRELFRVTPQDLLILFFALVVPNLSDDLVSNFPIGQTMFRLAVLFYVTEFLLNAGQQHHRDVHSYRVLRVATVLTLGVLATRGLIAEL